MILPPPPPLESLPYGTRLVAGMSHSTIVAEGDFETYSPAGFVWQPHLNKWGALPGAPQGKKGLPVVGATIYTEHPSAEVLVFKHDLKDGKGRREWRPGMPNPTDLFEHLAAGGLFEAWNAGFEVLVWQNICVPKYGWPPLPVEQVRCAMAKARAHALPGGLEAAGRVLNLRTQKDGDGKRLIQKFCIPRNPTKNDARTRHKPTDPDCLVDGQKLYDYCGTDIATEAEASSRIPDLCALELPMWQMDQRINRRGVAVDVVAVENCIAVIEQAYAKYNAELYALTGGVVAKASELQKLIGWLGAHGVATASLDEEHLDALLARKDLPPHVYRALELRAAVGSAAVKKLYALRNTTARDGRVHDLFSYHAARTGRTTGNGAQPTNFPNSGPDVYRCGCCKHYFGVLRAACPWCGVPVPPTLKHVVDGWGPEAVEDALAVIAGRSLELVEWYFGNALAAISGCLRGLFIAPPGRDLICSDYSSIEAVVLAMIAGEQWRIDVFRTHGKIYEMSAAKIAGLPFEDFMRHAGYTYEELSAPDWYTRKPKVAGSHHPLRKTIGKVAELACFSPETQVLTRRGYVAIVDVNSDDMLWDGEEWVTHQGVVNKGQRQVIRLDGVRMTPTHPISTGHSWRAASELASNEKILSLALANGSENLPWSGTSWATAAALKPSKCNARVVPTRTPFRLTTCERVGQRVATVALRKRRALTRKNILPTPTSWRMTSTADACLTAYRLPSAGATPPRTGASQTTGAGASPFGPAGERTNANSCGTLSRLRAGTTRAWKWTASTSTRVMSPETCGLSQSPKTPKTSEASKNYSDALPNLSTVYDIVNAGPRHRFTIKTDSGHLIVHNSGYQGWLGAWVAFGADAFMTEDEIKTAILAWRDASPAIVEFWGGQFRKTYAGWVPEMFGIEGMAVSAILNPGQTFEFRGFSFTMRGDVLYLRLLSGRYLTYHRPRLSPSDRRGLSISYEGYNTNPNNGPVGWIRMNTWGGRLTENIVQAVARDIQWHGMRNLEAAGYDIVLHVYDEDIAEVPEGFGSVEEFERIMSTMPAWAHDWPIRANGGWRRKRYGK